MRIFKILRISFLTLFGLFKTPTCPPFNTISIGPLMKKGETKIVVDTDSDYLKFSINISNDLYSTKEIYQGTVTKPGVYTYVYNNEYTRTKNKVFIKYTTTEGGTYKTSSKYDFNITGSSKTRYINDDSEVSTTKTIGVFRSDLSFEASKMNFSFEGFIDYYAPDYYHKIDLKEFKIHLDSKYHTFMSSNPYLIFANVDNVFADIENVDDYASFDLTLVDQGDYFTFALAHTMYVNPNNLRMSSNPKVGYIQTDNIFLPVNEMSNQKDFGAYFAMKSMGIDLDYWVHKFEIKAETNLFGDCHNSKYCVARVIE